MYVYTQNTKIGPSTYVITNLNNRVKTNNHLSSFDTWLYIIVSHTEWNCCSGLFSYTVAGYNSEVVGGTFIQIFH